MRPPCDLRAPYHWATGSPNSGWDTKLEKSADMKSRHPFQAKCDSNDPWWSYPKEKFLKWWVDLVLKLIYLIRPDLNVPQFESLWKVFASQNHLPSFFLNLVLFKASVKFNNLSIRLQCPLQIDNLNRVCDLRLKLRHLSIGNIDGESDLKRSDSTSSVGSLNATSKAPQEGENRGWSSWFSSWFTGQLRKLFTYFYLFTFK